MAGPNMEAIKDGKTPIIPMDEWKNNLSESAKKIGGTVTNVFNNVTQAAINWKLILIGALALVVLLKD